MHFDGEYLLRALYPDNEDIKQALDRNFISKAIGIGIILLLMAATKLLGQW